jgi:hypothetical protein
LHSSLRDFCAGKAKTNRCLDIGVHRLWTGQQRPAGFARVFNCDILTFVPTLREDRWTWHDSIRLADGCGTIPGTSGSPIISVATGELVGVNNTSNENGQSCTLDNPCEVADNGSVTVVQGRRYGQEAYWFTTCLTTSRTIDLSLAGFLLTRPSA